MTETQIANKALAKLGGAGDQDTGSGIISSIDDPDKVSAWCKELLPHVRKQVISDFAAKKCPFRETVKYADLGAENASPPEIGGWTYCFTLPGDCLAIVRQVSEDFDSSADRTEYRHEIITNGTQKLLLTDTLSNSAGDSAYIEYCIDNETTGSYSQGLIECISTLLAAELCPILGKNLKTRQKLMVEYSQYAVPNAAMYNQSQYDHITEAATDYLGERE